MNSKYLTESARITDAYSQMYAHRTNVQKSAPQSVNESTEGKSFSSALRSGDLPVDGVGSRKTGSKLGRRDMLPFEKRDAKPQTAHRVPMKKTFGVGKVSNNYKTAVCGKSTEIGSSLTGSKLGARKMMDFDKRDAHPTSIGRIGGVKNISCVKGVKESEEDVFDGEMEVIDTDTDTGIDTDTDTEEGCCEECRELFELVNDTFDQIYDNLSDDDKALVDEVKMQIEEKLEDAEEDDVVDDEIEDDEIEESIVNEAKKKTTNKNKNRNRKKARPTKKGKKEIAYEEYMKKLNQVDDIHNIRDVEQWKTDMDAYADKTLKDGTITAEEAASWKKTIEASYEKRHDAKAVVGDLNDRIDTFLRNEKTATPEEKKVARAQIESDIKAAVANGHLTEAEARQKARQIATKWGKAKGLAGDIVRSLGEKGILYWILAIGGVSAGAAGSAAITHAIDKHYLAGSGDNEHVTPQVKSMEDAQKNVEQYAVRVKADSETNKNAEKATAAINKMNAEQEKRLREIISDELGKRHKSSRDAGGLEGLLTSLGSGVGGLLGGSIGGLGSGIGTAADSIGKGMYSLTSNTLNGVLNPVTGLVNTVADVPGRIIGGVSKPFMSGSDDEEDSSSSTEDSTESKPSKKTEQKKDYTKTEPKEEPKTEPKEVEFTAPTASQVSQMEKGNGPVSDETAKELEKNEQYDKEKKQAETAVKNEIDAMSPIKSTVLNSLK